MPHKQESDGTHGQNQLHKVVLDFHRHARKCVHPFPIIYTSNSFFVFLKHIMVPKWPLNKIKTLRHWLSTKCPTSCILSCHDHQDHPLCPNSWFCAGPCSCPWFPPTAPGQRVCPLLAPLLHVLLLLLSVRSVWVPVPNFPQTPVLMVDQLSLWPTFCRFLVWASPSLLHCTFLGRKLWLCLLLPSL